MTDPSQEQENAERTPIPQANVVPYTRTSWLWIVPVIALAVAGWLCYDAISRRGVRVSVEFEAGYGLEPGDDVRYRGASVGHVTTVEVAPHLKTIHVELVLDKHAALIARAGARFWIVRPQLGASGVAGLETIVGPRYLAVLPGRNEPQFQFVGLEQAPIVESRDAGDLDILLSAPNKTGLNAGARVTYRQVPIGTIVSVGLTSDAGAVEARVHIPKAYTQLVRTNSHFWNAGGVEADIGFRGVSIQMESLQTIITGGIAMATPSSAGEPVRNGHRFDLDETPPKQWQTWRPSLMVGSDYLPPGEPRPAPLRAVIGWKEGRWIESNESRSGWVLAVNNLLVGPADLLAPQNAKSVQQYVLEVAGDPIALPEKPEWSGKGVAAIRVSWARPSWPTQRTRALSAPEDCVLIADAAAPPLPIAAARLLHDDDGRWRIDPAVAVDHSWHGACLVSRTDGFVVGIVLAEKANVYVAPLDIGGQ